MGCHDSWSELCAELPNSRDPQLDARTMTADTCIFYSIHETIDCHSALSVPKNFWSSTKA